MAGRFQIHARFLANAMPIFPRNTGGTMHFSQHSLQNASLTCQECQLKELVGLGVRVPIFLIPQGFERFPIQDRFKSSPGMVTA
jgi:hypothetical protein